jgi:hypothetical protein
MEVSTVGIQLQFPAKLVGKRIAQMAPLDGI